MSSLYDNYATQTGAAILDHQADVNRVAEHFRSRILPYLPTDIQIADCRIFEFGAGWGRNLLAMAELGATEICGVDISEEQVTIGRRLGLKQLELVAPDSALPPSIAQAKFDIVLAIDVLEHLDLNALHNFSRLVRELLVPNGLLIVQVPNALAPFNPVTSGDITHLRGFTSASLRQLFAMAATEPIHLAGMPFPGRSVIHTVRAFLTHGLVAPTIQVFSWLLYGRSPDPVLLEPNILGVARARQGTKP
jgi:2-polyprenyl-3-methyl-5-hydroxy-6-metoxy-1,4-benzoquinol methylase